MVRRMRTLNTVLVIALATAGIAGASRPCHPDMRGTRSLAVTGQVTGYSFAGRGILAVSVQTKQCAGSASWNYAANPHTTASVTCDGSNAGGSTAAQQLVAAEGDRLVRVVLAPDGVDRPDRLDVIDRATGRRIASWPLMDRPTRVVLFGGIAILSAANRSALYALRISDGRIGILGIAREGDQPIIGPDGVAYQDDQYLKLHSTTPNSAMLKLVPLADVRRRLSFADQQVRTKGRITAIGMDGRRVAFAVHDPKGRCDAVKFWIPPWDFVARVTHRSGLTCLPKHAAGGVTNVAIAANRLVWTTQYGKMTRVLAASSIACQEWIVARLAPGAPVAGLAGHDGVLAYALKGAGSPNRPGTVGLVPGGWRGEVLSRSVAQVAAIAVDGNHIATLYRDGTLTVMSASGDAISRFDVGRARAIALRGDTVSVLRRGHLAVYGAGTGRLTHSWPVPANARSVDLQYGIAVVAAGGDVLALNVSTGRTAHLLHVRGDVAAQIDSPGAVVKFNVGERGYLRFIPMSTIEARTS